MMIAGQRKRTDPDAREDLFCSVTVSTSLLGFAAGDHIALADRLAGWRSYNVILGLTGALLVSSEGIVLVLEGTAPSIMKLRRHIDTNPLHGEIQLLDQSSCLRRRFGGWPLAYVGPSRWVQRALGSHAIADMTAESPSEAEFLIDLVLTFVGDGA